MPSDPAVTLVAGDASAVLRPDLGGRVASLVVDGIELLVTEADRPIDWGLYPMAPFAGRVRHGVVSFAGRSVTLPLTLPPHAIHGTLLGRRWDLVGDGVMEVDLREPWPFAGRVRHAVTLADGALTATITVEADEVMPAWVGWHPWLRRRLSRGSAAALHVEAGAMYERDHEGIPTGTLVPVPEGPYDDCFTDLQADPVVEWEGAFALTVESSCRYLVVFDEPEHAVCVEPQSAPPDALNLGLAAAVTPERPLTATMRLRWARP